MKKITIYICLAMTLGLFTQCSDYLDTENPGQSDDTFVMSSTTEALKTLTWAYAEYRQNAAHGGNYNYQDVLGSDAEYLNEYPTANNVIARVQPEATAVGSAATQYNSLNIVLARAARIADVISGKSEYQSEVAGSAATTWTHLYGEARALRAFCAWELVRHFGDVPYGYENKVVDSYELSSRFAIMDDIMADLKAVEGKMFKMGEGGITAERISSNFVNALIGEIALHAAGWQTIRTDVPGLYGDVQFDNKGADDGKCVYARRKDYVDYAKIAEQYLDIAVNKMGTTKPKLITTDSRTPANPFQRHWQEINSRRISDESFFEIGCVAGVGNCEHPYSMGRAGSNNSAVSLLNTFAAIRMIPTFFYNAYEDGDLRRDASMVVTGSDAAKGIEVILPFGTTTRIGGGGPCINKWDQNRGDVPNYPSAGNRASGMNYTVMRMADAMLMLAEAKAIVGTDNAGAMALVNQIRARAFGNNDHALSGLSGEALLDKIYAERKLELLGEGDIRWDMIRSGKFNDRAIAVRQEMKDMIAGLEADGYYTFSNGRTISNYIWTKNVQLNGATAVVTQECTNPENPALYPGWRGIYNWGAAAHTATAKNLAIKGLYEYIDPAGADAKALEADGYTKTKWGIDICAAATKTMLDGAILDGVVGRETKAPRYFHPMPVTVIDQSKGAVTNGYGLPQK